MQKPHCSALVRTKALCSSSISRESLRPFDRCPRVQPSAWHGEHEAAAHDLAVDAHGAGAAHAVLAADVGAGELELDSEEIGEVEAHGHGALHPLAVDGERDLDGFGERVHAMSCLSTRPASTLARCSLVAAEEYRSARGARSASSFGRAPLDGLRGRRLSFERASEVRREQGPVADAEERGAHVGEFPALGRAVRGDPGDGVVAVPARELAEGRGVARLGQGELRRDEQLVALERGGVEALEEILGRDAALALLSGDDEGRAQRERAGRQLRRGIAEARSCRRRCRGCGSRGARRAAWRPRRAAGASRCRRSARDPRGA